MEAASNKLPDRSKPRLLILARLARFPEPSMPILGLAPSMFLDSFLVAVIGYTLAISMTKILAKKKGYTIDPTQELYAQVSQAPPPPPPNAATTSVQEAEQWSLFIVVTRIKTQQTSQAAILDTDEPFYIFSFLHLNENTNIRQLKVWPSPRPNGLVDMCPPPTHRASSTCSGPSSPAPPCPCRCPDRWCRRRRAASLTSPASSPAAS